MGLEIIDIPVTGKVGITAPDGTQEDVDLHVETVKVSEEPAVVGYRVSHTRNLGNYESLRIEVSITRPCPAKEDSIENAHAKNKDWVETKMEEVITEVDSL